MATVLNSDEKLEKLKIEILRTFEELSNYLSIHKQKLLSRLIRIKEGYDKNTELNAAIEQLRSVRDTAMKVMKSNLLESMGEDFDNRLKLMEDSKVEVEDLDLISFRCYSDKIRKSIDEIDLIELIPEYHRIQVFDTNGKFLHSFGDDKLQKPFGICVSKDFVFVTDEVKKCVMKFTLEGIFKNSFDGTKQFFSYTIRGIDCCDKFLYICDYGYQRISVF